MMQSCNFSLLVIFDAEFFAENLADMGLHDEPTKERRFIASVAGLSKRFDPPSIFF